MNTWPPKDPDEVLDYQLNWSQRLVAGETIASSTFYINEGDVVKDSEDQVDALTTVWLSGGSQGSACLITNRITTSMGRTYDESVRLRIRTK